MLPISADAVRVFLHVLAASVWVGGQLVLAGLVPTVRQLGPDAPKAVARRFNAVAWPAFVVLVVTGIWNLLAESDTSTEYQITFGLKMLAVVATGAGAAWHATGGNRLALALGGALAGIGGLVALFLGVLLAT